MRRLACHLRPVAGRREEKPQGRDRAVHRRRLHTLLALTHLIQTQIFRLCLIRRAAEEEREIPDVADIVALRLLSEAADRHVLDHAATKRAYGRLAHGSSWSRGEVANPSILKPGRFPSPTLT